MILLNSNFWTDSPLKKRDRVRVADIVLKRKEHFIYEAVPSLFYKPELHDDAVKSIINEALMIDAEAIAAICIGMSSRENNKNVIEKYSDRILIIQGRNDSVVLSSQMEIEIKGVSVKYILVNSGHMSHLETSQEVENLITKFIK